jgi:P4 family phage/plasmid primase-like protien
MLEWRILMDTYNDLFEDDNYIADFNMQAKAEKEDRERKERQLNEDIKKMEEVKVSELEQEYNIGNNNYKNKGTKTINNPYMYAKIIKSKNIFWTMENEGGGNEVSYIYDKNTGMYDACGESRIKAMTQIISDREERGVNKNVVQEVVQIIKRNSLKPRPADDQYDRLLLYNNGIYDMESKKFTYGFNPEYFITSRIPWPYSYEERCDEIKKFVIQVLVPRKRWMELNDLDLKKLNFVQELFGYCLYRGYPLHYLFMFLGRGDNGKGVLLRLFKAFVGKNNVSAVQPQKLDQRFQASNLYGKHINMFGDLPGGKLRDTGTIKTLIGEDTINAEFKGQKGFDFTSYAKIIVATNEPFRISIGEPEAFFRKIMPLYFPNRFTPDNELFYRLTTEKQMSGLINWATEGLERLLKNKGFSLVPIPRMVEDLFPRFGERGEFHAAPINIKNVDIKDIDKIYEDYDPYQE